MNRNIHCSKQVIYYNVEIPHNDFISIRGSPTPAIFSEVRDEPIFNGRPCDWMMSVIRFTIPTSLIPIQFFPVQEDLATPLNRNKSIYSITLSYLGVDYECFLQWVTQNNGVPLPPPPTGITERAFALDPKYLDYYSLYSFNHFATIINTAINTCFVTHILPLLPALPVGKVYKAPYLTFDGSSKLFTLNVQSIFLDTTVNNIQLWFNTFLNENFDVSFDTAFYDFSNPNGKNVRYILLDRGEQFRVIDSTAPDGFIYKQLQEFDSTGMMMSFTGLILRSTSLPINNEIISVQPKLGGVGSGIGGASESIISDFEIDLSTSFNLRPYVHYVPQAEFRRINLKGESPIQRMDIEILWKDNYDNFYPIMIPAHNIATIKIMFEQIN